ncbi:MAG: hypothetical protein U0136_08065 [Bdellovibrionota bacterium]
MLFCMMPIERNGQITHQLCLVPDKPDPLARAILVDELEPTDFAVFRVGQEEACNVTVDHSGALIISAMEPAMVFLTPNLAAFPGMRARHVKVVRFGDRQYRTYYSKDKERWDEWTPNVERAQNFEQQKSSKEEKKEERVVKL